MNPHPLHIRMLTGSVLNRQPQLLGLAQRFYQGQKPRFSAALPDAEGLTSSLKTHGYSGHSLCLSH